MKSTTKFNRSKIDIALVIMAVTGTIALGFVVIAAIYFDLI